jgi:hypothetical protein
MAKLAIGNTSEVLLTARLCLHDVSHARQSLVLRMTKNGSLTEALLRRVSACTPKVPIRILAIDWFLDTVLLESIQIMAFLGLELISRARTSTIIVGLLDVTHP